MHMAGQYSVPPVRGNRRFRPGLLPTLAVLVLLPAFVLLGNWQLDRADFKRERLRAFAEGSDQPVPMGRLLADGVAADAGIGLHHVVARGRWADGGEVFLEGMTHAGRAGYHVLTPFVLDAGGRILMVNRGWVARDYSRKALPALPAPARDTREVRGVLRGLPVPGMRLGAGAAPGEAGTGAARDPDQPVALLYPTAGDLARRLGRPVVDGMLLLDPAAPDGFTRAWTPAPDGPQKHLGYAIQWYAFAATLLVLYLILNVRRDAPSPTADRAPRENAT